jgi:transposase
MVMYCSRRRRLGSTSPPLTGIEPNPGPRTAAKRKTGKQDSITTPKRSKLQSSLHSSPDQREQLKELLESGRSQESIIREGKFSKKMVARWAKKLKPSGDNNIPEPVPDPEPVVNVRDEFNHLSDFEKGEIKAFYYAGFSLRHISKRLGRSHTSVRRWIRRMEDEETYDRYEGSGRPRATSKADDRSVAEMWSQGVDGGCSTSPFS